MTKRSKTKRFYQHSEEAVRQHDQRFPYHTTLEEAEENNRKKEKVEQTSLGGL